MRINEVTYEKLKTPLKVNGNLKTALTRGYIVLSDTNQNNKNTKSHSNQTKYM